MVKLVCFDFDGVIAQTERQHTRWLMDDLDKANVTYTKESMAVLTSALDQLKTLKNSNVTAEDPMVSDITTNYGTSSDRVKGYGSVANSEDKDGKLNRFKKGLSTFVSSKKVSFC